MDVIGPGHVERAEDLEPTVSSGNGGFERSLAELG
jgi:hypothetical protein